MNQDNPVVPPQSSVLTDDDPPVWNGRASNRTDSVLSAQRSVQLLVLDQRYPKQEGLDSPLKGSEKLDHITGDGPLGPSCLVVPGWRLAG